MIQVSGSTYVIFTIYILDQNKYEDSIEFRRNKEKDKRQIDFITNQYASESFGLISYEFDIILDQLVLSLTFNTSNVSNSSNVINHFFISISELNNKLSFLFFQLFLYSDK